MNNLNQHRTWLEISQKNLRNNVKVFKKNINSNVELVPVVKSNAYGHGLEIVFDTIKDLINYIAVDSVDEAIILKQRIAKNQNIFILGYTVFEQLKDVVSNNFIQVVANIETLEALNKIAQKLKKVAKINLKIETGTSRQGIFFDNLEEYLELIKNSKYLELTGVSTHFANIEDTTNHSYAEKQLKTYSLAIDYIKGYGFNDFFEHTASSAAIILYPKTHFNLVRLGISLYGMWPSKKIGILNSNKFNIKPCLTWKTKVAHIKNLKVGTPVSYGCTEKLQRDSIIAVLPIGYWDGYDRGLSSIGEVLIKGKRCRVIGRVCMNMIMVDVTDVNNVKLEDEVVLLGKQGQEYISAEEIAQKLKTINYEITTRINPCLKRILV